MLFSKLFRTCFRPHRRRGAQFARQVQPLEVRSLPAGTVYGVVVANTLYLTGDNANNSLKVAATAGGVNITGTNGTQIKFLTPNGFETIAADEPFQLSEETELAGGIVAHLFEGNDSLIVTIDAGVELNVAGNVFAYFYGGDDGLAVHNYGILNLDGSIYVDSGIGHDTVHIVELNPASTTDISGALTVFTGAGNDHVLVGGEDVTVLGAVTINTGSGDDEFTLFDGVLGGPTFGSLLTVDLGSGNDGVLFDGNITVAGLAIINAGEGNDDIGLNGDDDSVLNAGVGPTTVGTQDIVFGSSLTINGAGGNDNIGIAGTSIDGNLLVNPGTGNDCVGLLNVSVDGNLTTLDLLGNDKYAADVLNVSGFVTMNDVAGADTLIADEVAIGKSLTVWLGLGNDNVILGELDADPKKVYIDGGAGTDRINRRSDELNALKAAGAKLLSINPGLPAADAEAAVTAIVNKFIGVF